jgi:hypothetical protein
MISSILVNRRCRFFTITGSKVLLVSRGTAISTGPISVNTVFDLLPLREFPLPRPTGSCLSYPKCSAISASNAVSSTFLVSWLSSPLGPTSSTPCSFAWASSCSANCR